MIYCVAMTVKKKSKGFTDDRPSPRLWVREPVLVRNVDGTVAVEGIAPLLRVYDRAVPEAFKAWIQRPDAPAVAMLIERVEGKYGCTEIHVAAAPGEIVTREALKALALPALVRTAIAQATHVVLDVDSAWAVGRARLQWLMGEPLDDADGEWLELDDDELTRQLMEPIAPQWLYELSPTLPDFQFGDALALPAFGADLAPREFINRTLATVEDPGRTRAASRLARLRRIAEVYNAAYNAGIPTTEAVARDQNVSTKYAKQLVRAARREGFLPPTTYGKKRGDTDLLSDG